MLKVTKIKQKREESSMNSIQQIVVKTLDVICKTIQNISLDNVGKLANTLQPAANNMILEILKVCIEEMDNALVIAAKAQRRAEGITIKEREVERCVLTDLGELHYRRTYFMLPDRTYAYLVDYLIGVEAYERVTKEFIAEILQLSTVKSYQQAVDFKGQALSRQTVHNRLVVLKDLAVPVAKAAETPEKLDIFADEDHAHLNPKGEAMIPLVTITEGIDTRKPKRHKTVNPLHIGAYAMSAEAFRNNVVTVINERYDLDKVKQINVHGDGGPWIKGLQENIPHSRFVMDGYHLEKEMRAFLKLEGARHYAKVIRDCMSREDGYENFEKYCKRILDRQKSEEGREKVRKFVGYCAGHWDSIVLRMKGETCGSCTESQISHVLSERLSRDPIAWSEAGLNRMTMLVVYAKNGGKVQGEDVRIRKDERACSHYVKQGFARYREYADRQANEVLKAKYDWGIFEHEYADFGKIDFAHLVRKSFGSVQSLSQLVS